MVLLAKETTQFTLSQAIKGSRVREELLTNYVIERRNIYDN